MMSYGVEYWSLGVRCPSCVCFQLPVHFQPPHQCGSTKKRKGLGTVKDLLSSNKNNSILSTMHSAQIQSTAPYPPLGIKLTLPQPKSAKYLIHKLNYLKNKKKDGFIEGKENLLI